MLYFTLIAFEFNLTLTVISLFDKHMKYARTEKLKILNGLNWDYDVDASLLLDVIEGRLEQAGPFDRTRIFVRSLERLPWHRIAGLWGVELSEQMIGHETISRVWIKDRREQLERLEKILRKEPVPAPEWGPELRKRLEAHVFSNRWYRIK